LALGAWMLLASGAAAATSMHRVLVLHSYNAKFSWVDSINSGLQKGLDAGHWDLWYDYLDSKNLPSTVTVESFQNLLSQKYGAMRFDLVVTVDDFAYQFFRRFRREIFHDTPALALGMNAPPNERLAGVSYLIETLDYSKTLNLALKQNPKAKTLHVVLDRTLTGQIVRRNIELTKLDRDMALDWIDQGSSDEVVARTSVLKAGEILVYGLFFNPEEGYESNDRVLRRVVATAQVPVYGFWSFILPEGAFGGSLYDGYRLGSDAAEVAQKLVTLDPKPVYRDQPLSSWIFNWTVARNAALAESDFPFGTTFVNQPPDFWAINRTAVVVFALGFLVLAGYTFLIRRSMQAQKSILAFGETMISTQRELMHNLGNVIENRSEETASHVQRITVLSLFLAGLADLTRDLRVQLELCAPMHDIGKVGIPDSILHKSGALTPEEYEVMKTHTTLGYSIFRTSANPMIQAAARIALEHHEHWDGGGYPSGKRGEDIDLLARIVSVVDVADALLSERSYKAPWQPDRVRQFLDDQAGKMFDPGLSRMVLDHWQEFHRLWVTTAEPKGEGK